MTDRSSDTRQLLHACTEALARLLACPDLTLENLEPTTQDAIEQAQRVLQAMQAHRRAVHCVVCGTLLPGVHIADEDRGHLVAYAHRACAEQAGLAGPTPPSADPTAS